MSIVWSLLELLALCPPPPPPIPHPHLSSPAAKQSNPAMRAQPHLPPLDLAFGLLMWLWYLKKKYIKNSPAVLRFSSLPFLLSWSSNHWQQASASLPPYGTSGSSADLEMRCFSIHDRYYGGFCFSMRRRRQRRRWSAWKVSVTRWTRSWSRRVYSWARCNRRVRTSPRSRQPCRSRWKTFRLRRNACCAPSKRLVPFWTLALEAYSLCVMCQQFCVGKSPRKRERERESESEWVSEWVSEWECVCVCWPGVWSDKCVLTRWKGQICMCWWAGQDRYVCNDKTDRTNFVDQVKKTNPVGQIDRTNMCTTRWKG